MHDPGFPHRHTTASQAHSLALPRNGGLRAINLLLAAFAVTCPLAALAGSMVR
ncbi:MAG: hypothetical protein ACXVY5_01725 [Gaiellales bacterium]